jgi:hypothetical protein
VLPNIPPKIVRYWPSPDIISSLMKMLGDRVMMTKEDRSIECDGKKDDN